MTVTRWQLSGPARVRVRPTALVVDHADARREGQQVQLDAAGWGEHACPGPDLVACPLLEKKTPCALVAGADVVVLAADHPRFAELHDAYRRLHPSRGIVASFAEGHGPTADQVAREDAIAMVQDEPSLVSACTAARRRAFARGDPW